MAQLWESVSKIDASGWPSLQAWRKNPGRAREFMTVLGESDAGLITPAKILLKRALLPVGLNCRRTDDVIFGGGCWSLDIPSPDDLSQALLRLRKLVRHTHKLLQNYNAGLNDVLEALFGRTDAALIASLQMKFADLHVAIGNGCTPRGQSFLFVKGTPREAGQRTKGYVKMADTALLGFDLSAAFRCIYLTEVVLTPKDRVEQQALTILHEMTHLVCDSDDVVRNGVEVYGPKACSELAMVSIRHLNADPRQRPENNADSLMFFAEAMSQVYKGSTTAAKIKQFYDDLV